MPPTTEAFLSQLHREHLKSLGFRKVRHTFSRGRTGYVERFQFQGSAWNDADHPLRFYINVGVEFADLPPREPAYDFPRTHCWTRIESVVTGAPREFDLPLESTERFAFEVMAYLTKASEQLERHQTDIRRAYDSQPTSRLSLA